MCTTVIVGKRITMDGSTIIARNCDADTTIEPVKFIMVPANDNQTGIYKSNVTGFTEPYPPVALRYQMAPFVDSKTLGIFGEAGINSENVAMSSTESIYGNEKVLALDPLCEAGIGEDSLLNMVLPYIHSARDGVAYLGKLVEKHGSHEGNGIIFSDKDEVWYMEIPTGHHWVASKLPEDHVAVIANQVSQQEIDFSDTENFMWSNGIQEFVEENFLNPDKDVFNFRHIFGTSTALDRRYNTPRVWFGQNYLGLVSDNPSSNTLPFSFVPNRKISHEDVGYILSSHYNETIFNPLGSGPVQDRERYRPISMARTAESHILQIRNHVPKELSAIFWFNSAPTAFNPYVPFYANANDTAPNYNNTTLTYNIDQAYWMYRTLAVLTEAHYSDLQTDDNTYLKEAKETANRFIHTIDALALKEDSTKLTDFLTQKNYEIAQAMTALAMKEIGTLVIGGLDLSKLTFHVNTDLWS